MKFQNLFLIITILVFAAPGFAASKLDDLSKFKKIAVETESILNKGDLVGAKSAGSEWRIIDKSIDHALSELRAKSPGAAAFKKAMADLVATFDRGENK